MEKLNDNLNNVYNNELKSPKEDKENTKHLDFNNSSKISKKEKNSTSSRVSTMLNSSKSISNSNSNIFNNNSIDSLIGKSYSLIAEDVRIDII